MIKQYTSNDDTPSSSPHVDDDVAMMDSQKKRKRLPPCCCHPNNNNNNKCGLVVTNWIQLLQIFGRKLILEVFGSAGAVWGFSEAIGIRTADTNVYWRPTALLVGVVFWARWITQFRRSVSHLATRRNIGDDTHLLGVSGLDGYEDDIEQQQYYYSQPQAQQQQAQQNPILRRKFSRQGSLGDAETSSLVAHASTPIKLSTAQKTTLHHHHPVSMMASPDGQESVGTTTTAGLNSPDSSTTDLDGLVTVLPRSLFSVAQPQQQPNLDNNSNMEDAWDVEDKNPDYSLRFLREG